MPKENCRRFTTELVDWLVSVEQLAHDVYEATAATLPSDGELLDFVSSLAENEKDHAELITRIRDVMADQEHVEMPEIRLDADLRTTIERPLRELQDAAETGNVDVKRALELIAKVEFTEWNEIFLYVLQTFGPKTPETEAVLAEIQEHERRIEAFIARLPAKLHPGQDVAELQKLWNVRVLLADDNTMVRELLTKLLEPIGEVTATGNGEEALEQTRRHFFDAVVSDLQMPVMCGLDFYRRAVEEHPDLKGRFLFVSSDPSPGEARYMEEENLSLLRKPFSPTELQQTVREITKSSENASA